MKWHLTGLAMVLWLACGAAAADVIYVDDDAPGDPGPGTPTVSDLAENGSASHPYDAIQEGIDAAKGGDTVLVCEGMYNGPGNHDIDLKGKAITLLSETGPQGCIIDCNQEGRGFYFHSGESASSVVDGFFIALAYAETGNGGGIYCKNSSPTIRNNMIHANVAMALGGGIYCESSSAVIVNNEIAVNDADSGGGIACVSGSPKLINNTITMNTAASNGGGLYCVQSALTITNGILWDNGAAHGPQIALGSVASPSILAVRWSDVQGGPPNAYVEPGCSLTWGAGSIDQDPLFVDPDNYDFSLSDFSPCVDTGMGDNGATVPMTDMLGLERYDDPGVPNSGSGTPKYVDMGAWERQIPSGRPGAASISIDREQQPDQTVLYVFSARITAVQMASAEVVTPLGEHIALGPEGEGQLHLHVSGDQAAIEARFPDGWYQLSATYINGTTWSGSSVLGGSYPTIFPQITAPADGSLLATPTLTIQWVQWQPTSSLSRFVLPIVRTADTHVVICSPERAVPANGSEFVVPDGVLMAGGAYEVIVSFAILSQSQLPLAYKGNMSHVEFAVAAGPVSDHVAAVRIFQGIDYGSVSDPADTRYGIELEIDTDGTVDLVEFLTPAGNTFQIPKLPWQEADGVETEYDVEGGECYWSYRAESADPGVWAAYGDGTYTITVYYASGGRASTTVWFGVPGTSEFLLQPVQEPVLTSPQEYSPVMSPVSFAWNACTDPAVNCLHIGVYGADDEEDAVDELLAVGATSFGPVAVPNGAWEANLVFAHGYFDIPNADSIPTMVAKYCDTDLDFGVGITLWQYEVWAGDTDYSNELEHWNRYYNIDKQDYVMLGGANGNATFSGNYAYYVIVTRRLAEIDSIRGSDGTYLTGGLLATGNTENWANLFGAPDGQYASVGGSGTGGTYQGYVVFQRPPDWTGITVITREGAGPVSDHVAAIRIFQGIRYGSVSDPTDTRYESSIEIDTDELVDLVEFLTPAGNTFQIPKLPWQEADGVETEYDVEDGQCYWSYRADSADPGLWAALGDGIYTFTVYYASGGQASTTVWFGVPGTSEFLLQPVQEPVLTAPQEYSTVMSPVSFAWEPCTDPAANCVHLGVRGDETDEEALDELYPVSQTSAGPVDVALGTWEAELDFAHGFIDEANADGIPIMVAKFTYATALFAVSSDTEFWGYIGAPREIDQHQFHASAGEQLVIDVDAASFGSDLDSYIILYGPGGGEIARDDDGGDIRGEFNAEMCLEATRHGNTGTPTFSACVEAWSEDSRLYFTAPQTGTYTVAIASLEAMEKGREGEYGEDAYYRIRVLPQSELPPFNPASAQATLLKPNGGTETLLSTGGRYELEVTAADKASLLTRFPDGPYTVRVDYGGEDVHERHFVLAGEWPGFPTVSQPADGSSVSEPVAVAWQAVPGVQRYFIELDEVGGEDEIWWQVLGPDELSGSIPDDITDEQRAYSVAVSAETGLLEPHLDIAKYSATVIEFTVAAQTEEISDHVFYIGVLQSINYGSVCDPADTHYGFQLEMDTDETVDLVEFLTPAGNTFQIPKLPWQEADGVETEYYVEDGQCYWSYRAKSADPGVWAAFGDGTYTITVYYASGERASTTVWFGVPGTTEFLQQPVQEPILTSPQDYSTVMSPVSFAWEPCTDPAANCVHLGVWNDETDEEALDELYPVTQTSAGPVELGLGTWEASVVFAHGFIDEANADGILITVVKFSEASEGNVLFAVSHISAHVSSIQIQQEIDYGLHSDPSDTEYGFSLRVQTDDTVELVEFSTPGGGAFQIPKLPYWEEGSVETSYRFENGSYWWTYQTDAADAQSLGEYGDGEYTITVSYAGGYHDQTSVWFGVPDTQDPIAQPAQEPVMLSPQEFANTTSPVTFTWQACTDPNVNGLNIVLENRSTGMMDFWQFPPSTVSSGPKTIEPGAWNVQPLFLRGYYLNDNGDGIPVWVGKVSSSHTPFSVSSGTEFWGYIAAPREIDQHTFQASAGDKLVIDVDAASLGSELDTCIILYGPDGAQLSQDDDGGDLASDIRANLNLMAVRRGNSGTPAFYTEVEAWGTDSRLYFVVGQTGLHTISIVSSETIGNRGEGAYGEEAFYRIRVLPESALPQIDPASVQVTLVKPDGATETLAWTPDQGQSAYYLRADAADKAAIETRFPDGSYTITVDYGGGDVRERYLWLGGPWPGFPHVDQPTNGNYRVFEPVQVAWQPVPDTGFYYAQLNRQGSREYLWETELPPGTTTISVPANVTSNVEDYSVTVYAVYALPDSDATKSSSTIIDFGIIVPGDINGDHCVNVTDLLIVRNSLGKPASQGYPGADCCPWPGGDGIINVTDLLFVRNNMAKGHKCH